MLKRIISFALVLLTLSWMGVIFSFSCENGGESAESSGRFIRKIVSVIDGDFDTLSPEEQTKIVEKYDHFVRKAAHFSIYAVLGGLLYLTAFSLGADKKKGYVVSVVIGALYAVSDEVHQYFVPGRACMIRDMLLDSVGVAIGAAVLLGLVDIIVKKTHRRSA